MKLLSLSTTVITTCILSACGGGGGGGALPAPAQTPQAATDTPIEFSKVVGIYTGRTKLSSNQLTYDVTALVDETGEFIILNRNTEQLRTGKFNPISTQNVTATFKEYDNAGTPNLTGTFAGKLNIEPAMMQFEGVSTQNGTTISTDSLFFNFTLDLPASFISRLSGNYQFVKGPLTSSISIDQLGNVTGANTDGCATNGTATIPDDKHNLYKLSLTITNCGSKNGSYKGLAAVYQTTVSNDTLLYSIYNDTYAEAGRYTRQ